MLTSTKLSPTLGAKREQQVARQTQALPQESE